ncbi:AAA family ATPase [Labedaea rhizosphaerae]|uniref:Regulatory LuxR family protein n=1 Tax=Labedaea rhizosphaerae TaxID=598644 RepID=A0A4R6SKE5_LABRH|nr:LuxR family transcriptional regulator [Labedaea rhizosphaerae]TDQ04387.1 regulatory LuxR family protein [Labedaea rhizosphaerae]
MILSERQHASEVVSDFTGSTDGSGSGLVLVNGGPGTGKTTVVHDIVAAAARAGALLLSATGSRAERAFPTGVLTQLLHGQSFEVTERVAQLAKAYTADPGDGDLIRQLDEVCGVVLDLAVTQPVVVTVDDVQFADTASLLFLLCLRRRMTASRVLMVLAESDLSQPTFPMFRAEITRAPHRRVRLEALSRESVEALASARLGADVAHRFGAELHRISGGNPMLVNALADDLAGATECEVGVAFREAVLACAQRWESPLVQIARSVAILDSAESAALTTSLLGITTETVEHAIGVLTAAGLLTDGRFRHPAAAAAVLDSMSTSDRARLHLGVAALLHQCGSPADEVAEHLMAAGEVDGDWSHAVLREAAEHALAGDEVSFAVRCLEFALQVARADEDRLIIVQLLVPALWRVNPAATAAYLPPLKAALNDGDLAPRDALTMAEHFLWTGDVGAVTLALTALNKSAGPQHAQVVAELWLAYHWFYGSSRGCFADAGAELPSGNDPWVGAAKALTNVWTHGGSDAASASAEHVLQSCRLGDSTVEVLATAVLALVFGNRAGRAEWWCDKLIASSAQRGATTWQALLTAVRADIALRRGEAEAAATHARAALTLLPARSWGVMIGYPIATLVLAETALERHEEAAEAVRQRVPEALYSTVWGQRYLHARGHHYLATNQVLAAVSDFQACAALRQEWDLDLPILAPWRSDLAQANLKLNRQAAARELVQEQLNLTPPLDARTRGITLRVLAASTEQAQRPSLLRQSVECLQASGDRLELAVTLGDLSQFHQQFERVRAAKPSRPAVRGKGTPVLSEAERRVAQLAVLGHPNREIGQRLFITVSTVEQHLTRIYRKLGVSGRSELPVGLVMDSTD